MGSFPFWVRVALPPLSLVSEGIELPLTVKTYATPALVGDQRRSIFFVSEKTGEAKQNSKWLNFTQFYQPEYYDSNIFYLNLNILCKTNAIVAQTVKISILIEHKLQIKNSQNVVNICKYTDKLSYNVQNVNINI